MASSNFLFLAFLAVFVCFASASDPSPLQDFCVADTKSSVLMNGLACKDPKMVQAEDFFFSGLQQAANTSNPMGFTFIPVTAAQVPGLNTLGISVARADYAPYGLSPPHSHPRASEVITILEGTLEVGFVTSYPENRLFTKVLQPGDVFVIPIGLIHYQRNVGKTSVISIVALSSQNPGIVVVGNSVFGSNPKIAVDVLSKAFHVDKKVIDLLQSKF